MIPSKMSKFCGNSQNRKPADTGPKMPIAHGVETAMGERAEICPICGALALLPQYSDMFVCHACFKVFYTFEEVE